MALVYFTEDYEKFYNCSFYNYHDIPYEERSSMFFGWLFLVTFLAIWILYIPFIIVMCDRELLKHSCYKLMIYLAILDLNTSLYTGFWAGILSITGNVFCYWPISSYWIGCLNGMAWKAQCIAIVILSFNRCLEALNEKWSKILFEGNKTFCWMLLPLIWGFHDILFGPPSLFNPIYLVIVYNPHAGYFLDSSNTTKVFGQIFVISVFLFMISVGFIIIQFVRLPTFFNPWLQYTFLLFDGQPAIIYLTLNSTMRKKVYRLFFRRWNKNFVSTTVVFANTY